MTDGVVLRGSGSDPSGSVIVMTGDKHTAIVVNNGIRQRAGNRLGEAAPDEKSIKVTDKYIPAGSYRLTVADVSGLSVGDNIEIRKPVTEKWIKYMKMNDLVRDGKPQTWIKAADCRTDHCRYRRKYNCAECPAGRLLRCKIYR